MGKETARMELFLRVICTFQALVLQISALFSIIAVFSAPAGRYLYERLR